ncbi:MAG: hypothetical protein K1X31_04115 [Gemmatimonadaceae bacterium]|nr:hypothetical protein [Gemmatimonadaceae bacterium]
MSGSTPLPKWFTPVAIVALLWNLMGASAYLMDVMMSPEAVAALTPAQRALYESRPAWFVAVYAIAVWAGVLGALGLVLKRRWARGLLLASLLALIVQDLALFTKAEFTAAVTGAVIGLQATVLLVAVGLILLARRADTDGWLT